MHHDSVERPEEWTFRCASRWLEQTPPLNEPARLGVTEFWGAHEKRS